MNIQLADLRTEFEIAISLAKREADPQIEKWREDMISAVVELTRKIYGGATTEMLQKGLNATVTILSVGLLRATEGASGEGESLVWLETLRKGGIKGVLKITTDWIKDCDSRTSRDDVYILGGREHISTTESRLEMLKRVVKLRGKGGYKLLFEDKLDRAAAYREALLGKWLIQNTYPGRILKQKKTEFFGSSIGVTFQEVCDFVLPRVCQFPQEVIANWSDPADSNPENDPHYYLIEPQFKKAKQAYAEFIKQIPDGLAAVLDNFSKGERHTWFDQNVLIKTKVIAEKERLKKLRKKEEAAEEARILKDEKLVIQKRRKTEEKRRQKVQSVRLAKSNATQSIKQSGARQK